MTPREDRLTNLLWEKSDYKEKHGRREVRRGVNSSSRRDDDAPLLRAKLQDKLEELRQLKKREKELSHHLRVTRSGELYLASSETTTAAARALRTEIGGLRNEAASLRHTLTEALEQESYWQGKATQPSSDDQYCGDPQERRRVHSAVTSALRVLQCLVHVALPKSSELLPPQDKCNTSQELVSRLLHSEAALDTMLQRYVRGAICEDQMLGAVQDSIPLSPSTDPRFGETQNPALQGTRRNDFSHPGWALVTGQQSPPRSSSPSQSHRVMQDPMEMQWVGSSSDSSRHRRPEYLQHVYNDLLHGETEQVISPRSPSSSAGYSHRMRERDPYASKSPRSGRGTPEAFLKSWGMSSPGATHRPQTKDLQATDERRGWRGR
eukprot:gnl/MRDRNA2_/MRDRNA2_69794_c0_seq1.p1 gnl/MRDRNA2_/MRDRNA2_69794_c0~~gnl/MRDRNA2_/MRDRNA2_69794_c0_seq1.p1  ORF type:complete len:379 (-),score=58.13 gnl/MRDRNA2_/MRDRNA2_69794_c0_seq1:16-1152(-)